MSQPLFTASVSAVGGRAVSASELQALVQKAHGVCPYSKATSGNIDVTLEVAE